MAHRSVGELMVWAVFLGLGFYCLSDLKAWFFDTRSVRAKISRSNGRAEPMEYYRLRAGA